MPIIFLTAHTERVYVERSDSLEALDYIMTPCAPEVLRTKVSVFVDLFKKTQKIKLQAESLRAHAEQLQRLNRAAVTINSARSLDDMGAALTEAARDVAGAHHAMTLVKVERPGERARTAVSISERYATFQQESPTLIAGRLCAVVCGRNKPLRMTQQELSQHPEWLDDGGQRPPPRAVPRRECFRRADSSSRRAHGGLGIGLSLVRTIVEAHGGSVAAESPGLEQGSTFVVRRPLLGAERGRPAGPRWGARPRPRADTSRAAGDLGGCASCSSRTTQLVAAVETLAARARAGELPGAGSGARTSR